MNRRIASVLFVAGVGFAVACSVDVDISKKACPCGPGYVCDEVAQLCVVTLPIRPVPTGDAATPPAPACDPCKCETSAECTDKTRPFCDVGSKTCVECDPKNDTCPENRYCSATYQCTPGCRTNAECVKLVPTAPTCAVDRHQCVECVDDTTCGADKCGPSGTCVKKCVAGSTCDNGASCCGELCIDTKVDRFNCGKCGNLCPTPNGGAPSCTAGTCGADCADGFKTCGTASACATNIRTDLANCGDCGRKCNMANVTGARCAVGKCAFTACNPFWLDADGNVENGCETPCGQEQGMTCCPGPTPCYEGKACKTNGNPNDRNKCL